VLEYERHTIIRNLLAERGVISVVELAALVGASEATIRRDIAALSARGEIKRVRGGASMPPPAAAGSAPHVPNLEMEADQVGRHKRAIARAAAALVEDGRSVILNGGTTTLAMTGFLAERELDVLTNSLPIAVRLLCTTRCRVLLPGGAVCRDHDLILSPYESDTSEHFFAAQMFTGAASINQRGVMESDPRVFQAVTRLRRRAEKLIVLADSRKLRRQSSMVTAGLADIDLLITDSGARQEELAPLREAGLNVLIAPD